MDLAYVRSLGLRTVSRVAAVLSPGNQAYSAAPGPAYVAVKPIPSMPADAATALAAAASVAALPTKEAPAKKAPSKEATPAKAAPVPAPAVKQASKSEGSKGKTEHVFLMDSYLFQLEDCKLLEAHCGTEPPKNGPEGSVKLTVVLDRTVFHPQGGGQPADTGTLSAAGLSELKVSFVSLRKEDGAVLHDCTTEKVVADAWAQAIGNKVACCVDGTVRRLAARLHSAGHLLDAAVTAVDPPLKWIPGKGFHFPDGPYVEYVLDDNSRKIDMKKTAEKDKVVNDIQTNLDRLVKAGGLVNVALKGGVRHVEMAGEECPCGGTHVVDISEIGKVDVKKMQNKQGNIRISYQVAAAA